MLSATSATISALMAKARIAPALETKGKTETATGQGQPRSSGEAGNSASSPKRQAILVLGMHRSGTSAVGGVVNALGAAAPKTLLKPDEGNPRGFFESAHLAVAHNSLLASAGSYWHDWRKLDPLWFRSE